MAYNNFSELGTAEERRAEATKTVAIIGDQMLKRMQGARA